MKKIIAIDFDGTIVEDRYPAIGPLKPGAKSVINWFYDTGCKIIIWTSRAGAPLEAAIQFLSDNGIKYHHVNESCPDNTAQYGGVDTRKIFADVYIDDKSLSPLPEDWYAIASIITDKLKIHYVERTN